MDYKKALEEAVKVLKAGGVVAHPTDTCYGFAASMRSQDGVKELYRLKKMSKNKPVSILVSSLREAKKYGVWNQHAKRFARRHWPGALTLVFVRKKSVPKLLNPGTATIGIRLPNHKFSRDIVRKLGSPIATTSANISGFSSPYRISEIVRQFHGERHKPAFIINGGTLNRKNLPSAVIDISGEKPKILRKGSFSEKEISVIMA